MAQQKRLSLAENQSANRSTRSSDDDYLKYEPTQKGLPNPAIKKPEEFK